MPMNTATFSVEDFDGEKSKTSVNVGPLTAANFTAKRAAINTLEGEIQGIISGRIRTTSINESFSVDTDPITEQWAQRESKWLVTYRDVTQFLDVGNTINNVGFGNVYQVEIPTAKLILLPANTDLIDLTVAPWPDFVTAFEAVQNSPTGGNEVEVVSVRHVGRAL